KKGTTPQCFFRPKKYFRMLFPNSSNLSSPLLNNFESSLTERLKKLIPQNKDEILTLPWMILAMELLYDTHNDINILITDLKLHDMTDPEHGSWCEVYMKINVKFLDLCNAFSSLLLSMNHGILCLKLLRHKLEMKSEDQCTEICSTLDSWRENITAEISKCRKVLGRYVKSLNFHRCVCDSFVEFRQRYFAYTYLEEIIVDKRFLGFADYQGDDLGQELFKESIVECKEEVEKLDHGLDELSRKIDNLSSITFKGRQTIREGLFDSMIEDRSSQGVTPHPTSARSRHKGQSKVRNYNDYVAANKRSSNFLC
ncbi:unnamed protein product, partial [Arabidopsis halleri]